MDSVNLGHVKRTLHGIASNEGVRGALFIKLEDGTVIQSTMDEDNTTKWAQMGLNIFLSARDAIKKSDDSATELKTLNATVQVEGENVELVMHCDHGDYISVVLRA